MTPPQFKDDFILLRGFYLFTGIISHAIVGAGFHVGGDAVFGQILIFGQATSGIIAAVIRAFADRAVSGWTAAAGKTGILTLYGGIKIITRLFVSVVVSVAVAGYGYVGVAGIADD